MRLVALGDSITCPSNPCGAGYPTLLTLPVTHNAGIGGDSTFGLLARLQADVLCMSRPPSASS